MITRKKTYFILFVTALLISFAVIFFLHANRHGHGGEVLLNAVPIKTGYGWGYNILADGKVYIHQDYMPAAEGRRGFKSPEDAMKVAKIVIGKIMANRMPAMTVKELDSLGLLK